MYVKESYIIQSVSRNFVVILRRNYLSDTLEEAQNFSNWSLQTISGTDNVSGHIGYMHESVKLKAARHQKAQLRKSD